MAFDPEESATDTRPLHRWPEAGTMGGSAGGRGSGSGSAGGAGGLVLRRPGRRWLILPRSHRYTQLPRWLSELMEGYQTYTMGMALLGVFNPPKPSPMQMARAKEKAAGYRRHHRFFAPSIDKLYATKSSYLGWLTREYDRYRAGLELLLVEGLDPPPQSEWLTREEAELEAREEADLNRAIAEELDELDRQFATELALIEEIKAEDWERIGASDSPGLALPLLLGADAEIIQQDLTNAASLGLFSRLAATRTDFLTFEGPKAWYEEELGQIHKVVEGVAHQLLGDVREALKDELRRAGLPAAEGD